MDDSMEAATEGKATGGRSEGQSRQEGDVPDREVGYSQPAMDTQPNGQVQERQEEPVLMETPLAAASAYSDSSPYPLSAEEGVSLPRKEALEYEEGQYYYYSARKDLLEKGLSPSLYGYQLTEDKRAAQSHSDSGEVYLASVTAHGRALEIDLCGASDELIRDHIVSAKREGMDRLIVRNASDGERIYDRIILFRADHLALTGKTDYEQDLAQVLPSLSSIVATDSMYGTDGHRGVEFLLHLDEQEKLASAVLDMDGHIIHAHLSDDSYEPLEMFIGRECDEVFGEGSFLFFRENPYYVYERDNQEELMRQKTRIVKQLMDESWEARLPGPLRMAYPDKVHVCRFVDYDVNVDVLALGESRGEGDRQVRFPLYPESLSLKDFESLLQAHDFYLRLENLVQVASESVPQDCQDELRAFIGERQHERSPETVKGIEDIFVNHEVLGESPEVMRRLCVLRRETGMNTVYWNNFPQIDSDELDWLIRSYVHQVYEEGPNQQLPRVLARHFPQLQRVASEGTREEYLDFLGHVETVACCKWEQQQASIVYDETDSVWQGGNAGGKWLECVNEASAYQTDPTTALNPNLKDFRGVERKADGFWHGYRYEQPEPRLLIDREPFVAYAFAKGSMSSEQAHELAAQIDSCRAGLHFINDVRVSMRVEPLYLGLTFTKEGKKIGTAEISASEIEKAMPLEKHLEEMSEVLLRVAEGEDTIDKASLYGMDPSGQWNRIFPDNYKVILENEYQWKLLSRYQEAKGIPTEQEPMRYPAERRINSVAEVDPQLKDKLIDMGDFMMGSYLEITPKAELDTLLSRFSGVFCTDLFEVHLERPQRVFDETGIRYYHTLIGKEGEYRLTSHRHDGNIPVPGYMNRQLLIDTLRTQEKQMGLRNRDVDNVLRRGVYIDSDHYMVKRMDDGIFYLSQDGYHGEGRGVELSAAFDCFEEAMQQSLTKAVRFHESEDCSDIFDRIAQKRLDRYYLLEPVPLTAEAQISGLSFAEDTEGKSAMAILTGRTRADFSEELTYPASLLPVRQRVLFEQQLTKEFSVSEKSHGLQVKDTPVYRGDREPEYNSMLLAEVRGKGLLDTSFNRPFSIRAGGHLYTFRGCLQAQVDKMPAFLFKAEVDGYALQLPVRGLPHEIAIPVVNETYRQLGELQTVIEAPRNVSVPSKGHGFTTSEQATVSPDQLQYLSDTLYAYGIERVTFEQPQLLEGMKVRQVSLVDNVLMADIQPENAKEVMPVPMEELPDAVQRALMDSCMEAVYGGQTESYRDALAEGDLIGILGTEENQCAIVDLPEYGRCEVALQRDHVMLHLPESSGKEVKSIPWLALESMSVKASIEDQLRSLPFVAEGERVLYQDSISKLAFRQGRFLLEGKIQSFDVTEACRQLTEAGVNLNQARRESLSAFCHRHKASFETDKGSIKAQLHRAGDEYELRTEPAMQKVPSQETESVL